MILTERRPDSVGRILVEEFLEPLGVTQGQLADAMGVPRKHANELCNDRRAITTDTALILGRVFDTSPDFWLNLQLRNDMWTAQHDPKRAERIERAHPIERNPGSISAHSIR
jgi:antitoxin HigA-1